MTQVRTVVLDNEAVQALVDPDHRKHRRALAMVEAVTSRNLRRAGSVQLVVPTAVRVEAGWDRRARSAAVVNRLRVADLPLDSAAADHAANVAGSLSVSVAYAHLAAALQSTPGPHAVVTSDRRDAHRLSKHLGLRLNIVAV